MSDSDLPKTREWEAYRAKWRSRKDLPVFIARRADAMAAELLARMAKLEAENTELRKQNEILSTTRRLEEEVREQAEAELDALRLGYEILATKLSEANAELVRLETRPRSD